MFKFWWRMRYSYAMEVYMGVHWKMAWAMSEDSYEDNAYISPHYAVKDDVREWFG